MRCRPSMWISRTTNSPSALCCPTTSNGAASHASAARSARHFARRVRLIKDASTELSREIVEQRNAHQQDQQRHAQLLADGLETFGQRATLEPFDGLEDDLTAVEDWNRQQIHESERQTDDDQEAEERRHAEGGGVTRIFGDAQRAAQ